MTETGEGWLAKEAPVLALKGPHAGRLPQTFQFQLPGNSPLQPRHSSSQTSPLEQLLGQHELILYTDKRGKGCIQCHRHTPAGPARASAVTAERFGATVQDHHAHRVPGSTRNARMPHVSTRLSYDARMSRDLSKRYETFKQRMTSYPVNWPRLSNSSPSSTRSEQVAETGW